LSTYYTITTFSEITHYFKIRDLISAKINNALLLHY